MWYAIMFGCAAAFAQGPATPGPFDRVPFDHWAYDMGTRAMDLCPTLAQDIERCVPDRQLTRYEIALLLARAVHWGLLTPAQAPKAEDQPGAAAVWAKLLREFWPELLMIEEQAKPSLRDRLAALPVEHWFRQQAQGLLAAIPVDAAPPSALAMMPRATPAPTAEPLPHDHCVYDAFTKLGDGCWPVPPAYCRAEEPLTREQAALGLHRLLSVIVSIEGSTPVSRSKNRDAAQVLRKLMVELQPEFERLESQLRDLGEPTVAARLEAIPRGHRFYPMAQALLGKANP